MPETALSMSESSSSLVYVASSPVPCTSTSRACACHHDVHVNISVGVEHVIQIHFDFTIHHSDAQCCDVTRQHHGHLVAICFIIR